MALTNITPTTELEALNVLLASIGEAPLSSTGSGLQLESMAEDFLKEAMREICTQRWRFNSEYSYAVSTGGDDGSGNPVYEVPSDLAAWRLSLVEDQRGIDVVEREERDYAANDGARIFADRLNGTDGIAALDDGMGGGNDLLIDPAWLVDFEDMPQSVRSAVTIGAARRFAKHLHGQDGEVEVGFTEEDERRALALMADDQRESVPVPPLSSNPQTELQALNQILVMAGLEPAFSTTALQGEDQYHALQILRDTDREIQAKGWKFNTEESYELEPDDTFAWTGSDGGSETLNVWEFPSDILDWELTPSSDQVDLSMTVRAPVDYSGSNDIFYDRLLNRDGLIKDDHEFLYIDVVWHFDFDELPEASRQYITILAARRFIQSPRVDVQLNEIPWQESDVRSAWRDLVKSQGEQRRRNIFAHGDMWEALGRRHPPRRRLTRLTNER